MGISVCKRFEFHASHFLPGYEGPCGSVHGHTWFGEVEVRRTAVIEPQGRDVPYSTFVVDFGDLGELVRKAILEPFDHTDLNSAVGVPSCEQVLTKIVTNLMCTLPPWLDLVRVRLHETRSNFAEWRREGEW